MVSLNNEPELPGQTNHHIVKATYSSPTNPAFTHTETLYLTPDPITREKKAYLSSLKQAVSTMQNLINEELTARMKDDTARESKANVESMTEVKEEALYGEESLDEGL
ncbi:hypothetical protein K3495_g9184 [Podosphaera aphanis]|nr:hypothetical protein K3495_g9184 [Podosphaera aphanis]